MEPKITVIAGSLRKDSFNKKLAKIVVESVNKQGAKATYIDLKEYEMPLYDGDIEARSGLPDNAKKLKKILKECDGIIFVSPEYNSSISAVLKNAIDWTSRNEGDEPNVVCYVNRLVLLMSASPSPLGGLRNLYHMRFFLSNIGSRVLPKQFTLRQAGKEFDEEGKFVDEKNYEKVDDAVMAIINTAKKLNA